MCKCKDLSDFDKGHIVMAQMTRSEHFPNGRSCGVFLECGSWYLPKVVQGRTTGEIIDRVMGAQGSLTRMRRSEGWFVWSAPAEELL